MWCGVEGVPVVEQAATSRSKEVEYTDESRRFILSPQRVSISGERETGKDGEVAGEVLVQVRAMWLGKSTVSLLL